jgi:hypothetical protein
MLRPPQLLQARVALARCLRRYTGMSSSAASTLPAADGRNNRSNSSSSSSSSSRRAFPAIQRLWLLGMQLHNNNDDASAYAAFNRLTWRPNPRALFSFTTSASLTLTRSSRARPT